MAQGEGLDHGPRQGHIRSYVQALAAQSKLGISMKWAIWVQDLTVTLSTSRHPSIFMTWANARDVNLLDDVSAGLQDQAQQLADSGASDAELQKVKKVSAAKGLGSV